MLIGLLVVIPAGAVMWYLGSVRGKTGLKIAGICLQVCPSNNILTFWQYLIIESFYHRFISISIFNYLLTTEYWPNLDSDYISFKYCLPSCHFSDVIIFKFSQGFSFVVIELLQLLWYLHEKNAFLHANLTLVRQ